MWRNGAAAITVADAGKERRFVRHGEAAQHDRARREPLLTRLHSSDVEQISVIATNRPNRSGFRRVVRRLHSH